MSWSSRTALKTSWVRVPFVSSVLHVLCPIEFRNLGTNSSLTIQFLASIALMVIGPDAWGQLTSSQSFANPKTLYDQAVPVDNGEMLVRVSIDREPIFAVDPFELQVTVQVNRGHRAKLVSPSKTEGFGDFNLKTWEAVGPIPTRGVRGQPVDEFRWGLLLEGPRSGRLKTSPILLKHGGALADASEHQIDRLSIQIHSILPKDADPRAIRGIANTVEIPAEPSNRGRALLQWMLASIGLLLTGGGTFAWLRKRQFHPHRQAIHLKGQIKQRQQMPRDSQISINEAHEFITEALKDWLAGQTGMTSSAMSSEEILTALANSPNASDLTGPLSGILAIHDSHTFAGQNITEEDLDRSADQALAVVDWFISRKERPT